MSAVLEEVSFFYERLKGNDLEKSILPILINFCLLDEKEISLQSLSIVINVLHEKPEFYLETVKKLVKADMKIAKECAAKLLVEGIKRVPEIETSLLEIYKTIVFSENSSYRITASKYLKDLSQNARNKEEISKIVDVFFNDCEDLPKLFAIDSLLHLYSFNSTMVMAKLKILISMNSWRVNIRLCSYANQLAETLSKNHFKSLLEPAFFRMFVSSDNEIRTSSCEALIAVASKLSEEEIVEKFYPVILQLTSDHSSLVKNQLSNLLIPLFEYFSEEKSKDLLIPLLAKLIRENPIEISLGILQHFKLLANYITYEIFEEKVLKPIGSKICEENWRVKIKCIELLETLLVEQEMYNSFIADLLVAEIKSKIEAVRLTATSSLINIIRKSPKEWSEVHVLPEVIKAKEDPNFKIRHKVVILIAATIDYVSNVWILNFRKIMIEMLSDKTSIIRIKALEGISENRRLQCKGASDEISKLKDDLDPEVQNLFMSIKV